MNAGQTIYTKIAGVTKRNDCNERIQEILENISGFADGEPLTLEHEEDNPYDKNAIKVFYEDDHIGYIKRDLAAEIASLVDQQLVEAEISEITGGDDGLSYGCNICLHILSNEERDKLKLQYDAPKQAPPPQPLYVLTSSVPEPQETRPRKQLKWWYIPIAVAAGLWVIFFIIFFATRNETNRKPASSENLGSASSAVVSQQAADPTEAIKADALKMVEEIFPSESISSVRVSDVKIELYVQSSADSMDWSATEQAAQEASAALLSEVGLQYAIVYIQDESGNNLLTALNGEITYNANTVETVSGPNPSTISLAEFEAIQTGMEYQEVFDIIGGRGTMLSEVDMGLGDEYYTVMYQWEGEGSLGANATVTFQGGVVTSKAQFGLE